MSRGRPKSGGMQKNVQVALGLVERDGPAELHIGYCTCLTGYVIGTDQEVPELRARGQAFGRMVDFCPDCLRVVKIFPGPPMYTRADLEGPERIRFYESRAHHRRSPKVKHSPGLSPRGSSSGFGRAI